MRTDWQLLAARKSPASQTKNQKYMHLLSKAARLRAHPSGESAMPLNHLRRSQSPRMMLVAMVLVACSPNEDRSVELQRSGVVAPPPAEVRAAPQKLGSTPETPKLEGELLRAIFGRDFRPQKGGAVAPIEGADTESEMYLITVVSTTELTDKRTVVIANATPSDADGEDLSSHASPGLLNVYFLSQSGGKWEVLDRRENVSAMGSHGHIGRVEWVEFAPGKPGFIVTSGGVWQGYSIGVSEVFDLAEGVRSLGEFKRHSSNAGACVPHVHECWDVDGTVSFVAGAQAGTYRDISVEFTGKFYTVTEGKDGKDIEHRKATVKETARYRFDGKKYQLLAGKNPVPDL